MTAIVLIATTIAVMLGIYKAIFSETKTIKDWYEEKWYFMEGLLVNTRENMKLFIQQLSTIMRTTGIAVDLDLKNNKLLLVDTKTKNIGRVDLEVVNYIVFGTHHF